MTARAALQHPTQRATRLRRRTRLRDAEAYEESPAVELLPAAKLVAGLAPSAPAAAALTRSLGPNAVFALQRTHGNRYVERLLAAPAVQRCGGDGACGCAHDAGSEEQEAASPVAPGTIAARRIQRQPGAGQPMLRLGAKSPAVATLQQKLGIAADGTFGPTTHKAVVAFQQGAGLTPDGIVGPKTWAGLAGGESAAPKGPAGAPNPLEAKRALLLAKLHEVKGALRTIAAKPEAVASSAALAAPGLLIDDPSVTAPLPLSFGWLDDAVDWAEEKADAAGEWVEEKAGAASDWVEEQAGAAGSWVEEQAGAAGEWIEEKVDQGASFVEETVESVTETVSQVAEQVAETASGVVSEVQSLADGLKERYKDELKVLEEVVKTVGQPIGLTGSQIDDALAQLNRLLAGLAKDVAAQHGGTPGPATAAANGSTTITSSATTHELSAPNIRAAFASPAHRGATKPRFPPNEKPELTLGTDSKVASATLNVAISKSLPKWKELDQQCDKAKESWASYLSALDFHEGKHVTIYKDFFTAHGHAEFVGKTEAEAAARFRAMKTESKAKNDDLDTTTNHGRTDTPSTVVPDPGC